MELVSGGKPPEPQENHTGPQCLHFPCPEATTLLCWGSLGRLLKIGQAEPHLGDVASPPAGKWGCTGPIHRRCARSLPTGERAGACEQASVSVSLAHDSG